MVETPNIDNSTSYVIMLIHLKRSNKHLGVL